MAYNNGSTSRLNVLIGLMAVVATVGVIWLLREAHFVFMPVAFGAFVATLVYPLQRWLYNHMPRSLKWASYVLTMLSLVLGLGGIILALWFSLLSAGTKAPEYAEKGREQWQQVVEWAEERGVSIGKGNKASEAEHDSSIPNAAEREQEGPQEAPTNEAELGEKLTAGAQNKAMEWVGYLLTSTWAFLAFLGVVFFLVLLGLIDSREWNQKICDAFPGDNDQVGAALSRIATKIRQFMWVRTVTSVISGGAIFLWLLIMGVDFAMLWAFLNFVLNYIPNVGSVIAGIPPSIIALLQFSAGKALVTIAGILIIENLIGNFIDPRMQGESLNISPFVLLVAVLFWSWMWGAGGALLSVPITVAMVVACEEIPGLSPIAKLLSGNGEKKKEKKGDDQDFTKEADCADDSEDKL